MPGKIREQAKQIVASNLFRRLAFSMTLLAVFTNPILYAIWHLQGSPQWSIPIHRLILFEDIFTTLFFIIESIIYLCAFGRAWLKSPMATINALVVLFTGSAYLFESVGLANPRILRLLRQLKGAARVSLTQRTRTREGVLGSEALTKLNEDDTWQALFILLLFSISTSFGGQDYQSATEALADAAVYTAIAMIMLWKSRRNTKQIHDVFVERMNRATLVVSERMREIPGLEESARRMISGDTPLAENDKGNTSQEKADAATVTQKRQQALRKPPEATDQHDEISNLVDSVMLIIRQMKRFISRRTFEEAKGKEVLPPDRLVALWFSDVANFSTMTKEMGPAIIPPLKKYFAAIHQDIADHQGDIDKFIGDAVFAFFHNETEKDHQLSCSQALKAAISCIQRSQLLQKNPEWQALFAGQHQRHQGFITRIGLHLGCVIAGPIGSEERADSTLIGDSVNIAARLESLNKQYNSLALMSEDFVQGLPEPLRKHCRLIDKVTVAGRENAPFYLYCLDSEPWPDEQRQDFEQGVLAYIEKRFEAASELIQKCQKNHPEDGPTLTLIKRIENKEQWADQFPGYWQCGK